VRRWLFVLWAGGGNVGPFVTLAEHLVARGDRVSAVVPAGAADRLAAAGATLAGVPDGWLPGAGDVLAAADAEPPDALVVDYMLTGALCAAERTGLPTVALVHTLYRRLLVGGAPHPIGMAGGVAALNAVRADLGLGPIVGHRDLLAAVELVLVTAPAELDAPDSPGAAVVADGSAGPDVGVATAGPGGDPAAAESVGGPATAGSVGGPATAGSGGGAATGGLGARVANVAYAGPLPEGPGPDAGWEPPVGEGPLVVVSTGTAGDDPALETDLLGRILTALGGLPVRGFVTVPGYIDPAALDPPPNVTVSPYVRHAAVLPHAAALVTHAGLGTVLAGLTHGVPLVCLPLGREQPDNARAVERLDAGVALPLDAPPDKVRDAVAAQLARTAPPVREPDPARAVALVDSVLPPPG
jgi:hypothetical protein